MVTLETTIPAAADEYTPAAAPLATAYVGTDGEFWCLGMKAAGFQTGFEGVDAQLGFANDVCPEFWSANVRLREERGGQTLMNQLVLFGHVFADFWQLHPPGSVASALHYPHLVHPLPAPWILKPGTRIEMDLTHRQPNEFRVFATLYGFKRMLTEDDLPLDFFLSPKLLGQLQEYRRDGKRPSVQPFFAGFNFDQDAGRPVHQAETQTVSFADSDFLATEFLGTVQDSAQASFYQTDIFDQPNELFSFTLDDGATRLMDRPAPISNVCGTANRPGYLPVPLRIRAGQNATAMIQFNDAASVADRLVRAWVTLAGVRVFQGLGS